MPAYHYRCPDNHVTEHRCSVAERPDTRTCEMCDQEAKSILFATSTLTAIIPSYPGSKKQAAGYVHSHADKAGTKTQSGYGGMITAGAPPAPSSGSVWKNPLG